jgi:chromosome segregation ATPase
MYDYYPGAGVNTFRVTASPIAPTLMISDTQEIVNYVNYQLNSLGFPLLSKQDNIKIVYNLLLVLEKESTFSRTVQQELSREHLNSSQLEDALDSLKKKFKSCQENYGKLQQNLQDLTDTRERDKSLLGKVKEEVVSLKKSLSSLKTLHVHEIRGKSHQIESLKQVINKKMNSLKNEIRENYYKKFTPTNEFKKEEELDFLFSSLKERQEELIRENSSVKEYFSNVLHFIKEEYSIQVDLPNIKDMPLDMLKENINSKLENVKSKQEASETVDLEMKRQLEEKTKEAGTFTTKN